MSGNKAALVFILLLALSEAAHSQDLFDRARREKQTNTFEAATYSSRDRLDLRVGARFPTENVVGDRGSAAIGLDGMIESDFACGKFDIRASLKNLLTKEAGEEMLNTLLGAVESELMYNGLVLACEASPTACQAFQHFRTNANALLRLHYDRCQAIESAVNDSLKGIRAKAIKDCVEEKRRQGLSMDQALAACQKADEMRGFGGDKVAEFDLTEELRKAFKLDGVDGKHLESLLSRLRLTPSGAKGQLKADAVLEEFDRMEKEYGTAWNEAVAGIETNPGTRLDDKLLARLHPKGSPGPLQEEVSEIAKLPKAKRSILLRQLASQAALLQLTMMVQDLERRLAAASKLPSVDAGSVRRMEQELRDLRLQLNQIEELASRQERYNATLLGISESAQAHQLTKAGEAISNYRSQESLKELELLAPDWGALPRRRDTTGETGSGTSGTSTTQVRRGKGCEYCGFGTAIQKP